MKKLYSNSLFLSALLMVASSSLTVAQSNQNCGQSSAMNQLYAAHPELVQDQINYDNAISQDVAAKKSAKAVEVVHTIPIVFHIIHTYGTENISDAQIIDEVAILNRDYRLLNTSELPSIVQNTPFDTLAADCKIQFKLAQLDPNGNCTNGIDRIYSHKTNNADDNSKLNQWPRNKYLNVWVVKSIGTAGVAGYAYYPSAVAGFLYPYDGVLILQNYIGSVGTSTPYTSRALTHEIGHWMNLQHPWGNNNDPQVACGDDVVDDTPETMGHLSCDLYTPHCKNGALADIYNFASVTPTSGTIDPTAAVIDSGIVFGSFKAMGVSSNPYTSGQFAYSKWDTGGGPANMDTTYASMTGAINTGKYYEVTITPAYAYSNTYTGIDFTFERSATGPRSYAIRSSIGGYATNLTPTITPANPLLKTRANSFYSLYDTTMSLSGSHITLPTATFKNLYAPVTFRIYAWNAEDSLGSFSVDNFSITGTAGIIENTQNYMDYSYCSIMYTKGQKDRMRSALEGTLSGRNNLWSAANLAATGTDGSGVACKPRPDFTSNKHSICAGSSVTYTKNIMDGTATSVAWSFPGGTPSTYTTLTGSPTVTYATAGLYPVQLIATNAAGADTVLKTDYIKVTYGSDYVGPQSEPFEVSNNYFYFWEPRNYDAGTNTWNYSSLAGYSSGHSVMMGGFNNYYEDVDDLISPSYNLSGMTGTLLTFRCAAASRASSSTDMTDQLKVYVSTDCGATWVARQTFPAYANAPNPYLINAGYHPEYYVPSTAAEWMYHTVSVPTIYCTTNVRFKFEYTTGLGSNNIYLDDINITGTVGINENTMDESSFSVYPNPTNQTSTIAYHLNTKANTKLQVVDVLGKLIMNVNTENQTEGDHSVVISKNNLGLNNGIYFIKLTVGNNTITKKLIITE